MLRFTLPAAAGVLAIMATAVAASTPTAPRTAVWGDIDKNAWMVLGCYVDGQFIDGHRCTGKLHAVAVQEVEKKGALQHVSWKATPRAISTHDPCRAAALDADSGRVSADSGRSAAVLPADHARYTKLIADALHTPELKLQKLIKVDLEGDGVDEVLFQGHFQGPVSKSNAEFYRGMGWEPPKTNDHALVGLRKVVGDKVVTIELARGEKYPTATEGGQIIRGLVDLDSDGGFEIVVSEHLDHSMIVRVFKISGTTARSVAGNSCGW